MAEPRTLRAHQQFMLEALIQRPRCNVWCPMGMGKTAVVLAWLDLLYGVAGEDRPTLILAPKRVVADVWAVEPLEWGFANIKVVPVTGDLAARKRALAQDANVFVTNYENAAWLAQQFGRKNWPFSTVVADESTRLKNFRLGGGGGVRARALGAVAHSKVERWINLTGTPAPNGLADLWGQTWFLDQGERLGRSFGAFEMRWFRTTQRTGKDGEFAGTTRIPNESAEVEIAQRLRDVTIRIRADDWFTLDQPIVNRIQVSLPPRAREHYRQLEREFFTEVQGAQVEAATAVARSLKCLQLASGSLYTTDPATGDPTGSWVHVHDAKIEALRGVVEEAAGMPVLVVYQWRADLEALRKAFPKGIELRDSKDAAARWNAGSVPVMFVHPQSAGHGLNLQYGGNILVFYSYDWSLENHDQVLERIGPMRQRQAGLNRPVFVHYLMAKDTMDSAVIHRLVEKASVQDALREAMGVELCYTY